MAITYPLTLPANAIKRITLGISTSVTISRSPFSYASQVQAFAGQMWTAEVTLKPMTRADAEEWLSFFLKLNGQEGTFLLGDPAATSPRGVATGTPVVNGSSQTGQTLNTGGWTNSITNILRQGDYFQVGQRLHKVLNDANSNGSGQATLDIFPRLRESPSNGASIVTTSPVGLFRLSKNTIDLADITADKVYALSFSAVEAV